MSEQRYWESSPFFWEEMDQRRDWGGNVVGLVIGPPNYGKSYWSMALCQEMHRRWSLPPFTIDGVVFNAHQFWKRMDASEELSWTVWDEPNKGLSHRDWYEAMNKAVTTFIQTFRFKRKNLLLALPHSKLVDKSVRAVCLFEANMKRPSLARLFQLEMDYFGNKEYFSYARGEVMLNLPVASLVRDYEEKKNEFHKTDFPEEAFQEQAKGDPELTGWKRIYALVKEAPDKFRVQDPRNPSQPGRLSARKISALLDCSDNTARKVVTKIEEGY